MFDTLLSDLASLPPGPELAAALAGVDLGSLSGADRVVALQAFQRQASHYEAWVSAALASVHDAVAADDPDPETSFKGAAAEIRVALRWTRQYAIARLGDALDLQVRLPQVWHAWAAGDIDRRKADDIAAGTTHLEPPAGRRVADLVLEEAPLLTTGELRARLRELCIEADADDAARRYHEAVENRRVASEINDNGTANLVGLDLPPHEVAAAVRYVNKVARSLRTAGESRTMDQLRADALLGLLQGRTPAGRSAPPSGGGVELRADLATLAGLDDLPGDLGGYGPVIADIARQVADQQERCEWRWAVTHPETGFPLHVGTTRRRPTARQARHVRARSPRCVFPGCRAPASDCDLDHAAAWAEARTTCAHCLEPLCPGDHTIRHLPGWAYQLLPDGDHLWTTRLGQKVTTSGRPP